jgi:transcriptional regulator GlxA family with amidase domain
MSAPAPAIFARGVALRDHCPVAAANSLSRLAEITVAECARRTGFDDPGNFSKFFRARARIAPGEFAARARGSADREAHPVTQGEA